ncbi:MAG: PilZ domain-containing protein [Deltaproteobacteria bacterium]|nr:PilZ domain-containing protein [Deltaproteobacteria bacterium]
MVNIKPGISGEILFEEAAGAEDRPVGFPTTIYSVSERRILLAQTDPPLPADDLGRVVVFTYVIHKESAPARHRFHARMVGFSDHEIAPGQRVPALVIERTSAPEPCNLRMNFRIKPSAERGLAVLLGGVPVVIVDISEGGVCVRLKGEMTLKLQDMVRLTVSVDGRSFDVDSQVVRICAPQAAAGTASLQQFVSLQFLGNQAARENILGRKLFHLERVQIKNKIR